MSHYHDNYIYGTEESSENKTSTKDKIEDKLKDFDKKTRTDAGKRRAYDKNVNNEAAHAKYDRMGGIARRYSEHYYRQVSDKDQENYSKMADKYENKANKYLDKSIKSSRDHDDGSATNALKKIGAVAGGAAIVGVGTAHAYKKLKGGESESEISKLSKPTAFAEIGEMSKKGRSAAKTYLRQYDQMNLNDKERNKDIRKELKIHGQRAKENVILTKYDTNSVDGTIYSKYGDKAKKKLDKTYKKAIKTDDKFEKIENGSASRGMKKLGNHIIKEFKNEAKANDKSSLQYLKEHYL